MLLCLCCYKIFYVNEFMLSYRKYAVFQALAKARPGRPLEASPARGQILSHFLEILIIELFI